MIRMLIAELSPQVVVVGAGSGREKKRETVEPLSVGTLAQVDKKGGHMFLRQLALHMAGRTAQTKNR